MKSFKAYIRTIEEGSFGGIQSPYDTSNPVTGDFSTEGDEEDFSEDQVADLAKKALGLKRTEIEDKLNPDDIDIAKDDEVIVNDPKHEGETFSFVNKSGNQAILRNRKSGNTLNVDPQSITRIQTAGDIKQSGNRQKIEIATAQRQARRSQGTQGTRGTQGTVGSPKSTGSQDETTESKNLDRLLQLSGVTKL